MDEQATREYVEKSHHTTGKLYRTDSIFKRRNTTEKRVKEQHHINSPKLVTP